MTEIRGRSQTESTDLFAGRPHLREGAVVVTGASSGLGASIMSSLSTRGVPVVGLSRRGTSPIGRGIACDVTDEVSIRAALSEVVQEFGSIGGLVNNAGIHNWGPSAQVTTEDFETAFRTNTTATFVMCREVHPHMVTAGGGVIVNIGSMFDRMGATKNVAYAASKAAVGAITRCLAVEWAKDAIQVVNIAPGYIQTELSDGYLASEHGKAMLDTRNPLKRAATSVEISNFVANTICEPVPYLSGETIYVDAGQSIAF